MAMAHLNLPEGTADDKEFGGSAIDGESGCCLMF